MVDFDLTGSDEHSHLFQVDRNRLEQVNQNHQAITALLEKTNAEGVLLTCPENFSWFTCGGDSRFQSHVEDSQIALFITAQGRVVLTQNSVSPQLFDREIAALGFQLKERNWQAGIEELINDTTRGRSVISDSGIFETQNLRQEINELRKQFPPYLLSRWKKLGPITTYAVEATCRSLKPGVTEAEIAGEISHRSLKKGVLPVKIQVVADQKLRHYRHWPATKNPIKKSCTIHFVGRKNGVYYAVTRSVSFSSLNENEQRDFHHAGQALAEALSTLKEKTTFEKTWKTLNHYHENAETGTDWRSAEFAWRLGTRYPEQLFTDSKEETFSSGTPWHWQSIVGTAVIGTSLVIENEKSKLIQESDRWPMKKFVTSEGDDFLLPETLQLSK